MKIISEQGLYRFQTWSGATVTKERIIAEGKEEEFNQLMDELYPDGVTDEKLNDLLWFGYEWIYETLGIKEE